MEFFKKIWGSNRAKPQPLPYHEGMIFDTSLQNSLQFFDRYLKTKFEFYLLNDFLANIIMDRDISQNVLSEIKQRFFVDVSTSLNERLIDNLAQVYTKAGLQLYIHQTFLTLFNKSMEHFKDNTNGTASAKINRRMIDAIMGS
jgi:hypothetical protein